MGRQDQIRKELIEKKLHDGIIKLSSRFDFDMDSIKVDSVLGVITIKNNPVYIRLLSSCHGGWDARLITSLDTALDVFHQRGPACIFCPAMKSCMRQNRKILNCADTFKAWATAEYKETK